MKALVLLVLASAHFVHAKQYNSWDLEDNWWYIGDDEDITIIDRDGSVRLTMKSTYYGKFDGNGLTIQLRDNNLFGTMIDATLKNVVLNKTDTGSGNLVAKTFAGSVKLENVKALNVNAEGSTATGILLGSGTGSLTITNCEVQGSVSGQYSTDVGGLVGRIDSGSVTITDTKADVKVSGNACNCGGFVGQANAPVKIYQSKVTANLSRYTKHSGGFIGYATSSTTFQDDEAHVWTGGDACGYMYSSGGKHQIRNCLSETLFEDGDTFYGYGFTDANVDEADNLVSLSTRWEKMSTRHFFPNVDDFGSDDYIYAVNENDPTNVGKRVVWEWVYYVYYSPSFVSTSSDRVNERLDMAYRVLNNAAKDKGYKGKWSYDLDRLYITDNFYYDLFDEINFSFSQFISGLTILFLHIVGAILGLSIIPCCLFGKCGCCCCQCAKNCAERPVSIKKVEMA